MYARILFHLQSRADHPENLCTRLGSTLLHDIVHERRIRLAQFLDERARRFCQVLRDEKRVDENVRFCAQRVSAVDTQLASMTHLEELPFRAKWEETKSSRKTQNSPLWMIPRNSHRETGEFLEVRHCK